MNFQEKVFEATADLRARAFSLANVALTRARTRAELAAKRVEKLKGSLATLSVAGRELNKVARQHASRFVKQNVGVAVDAGKDVSAIARSTYATIARGSINAKATKARKGPARKRATVVARKRTAKAA